MNSSIQFTNVKNQSHVQTLYLDNSQDFYGRLSPEKRLASDVLFKPAWLPRRPNLASAAASNRARSMQEEPNHKGLPPSGPPVASGNHDPKLVLFIDGAKTVARQAVLQKRMEEVAAGGGAKLRVDCVEGVVSLRLDRAAFGATANPTSRRTPRPVVGIDGVEQYLGSPCCFAYQVQKLISVDVAVVCTIDSRYCNWPLLAFYLRAFGLTVIREAVFADHIILRRRGRKSPTKGDLSVGIFPETDAPTLAEFVAQPRRFRRADAKEDSEQFVMPATLPRYTSFARAAWLVSAVRERESYVNAYQNDFAVGRLLRERHLH
ncbi:hypothetical protein FSB08_25150 [Paraburkholderia sp. JPY432]|uniref:hypothetical protein n=1 Tax=Paraburkholderia youngii TaxID=2782701 RepID=UPI0015954CE4|nr:hypothetical protein [Paraburkholderia youngii]NVH75738.1 hypothetical protein [Paraburkholderia youngii]